jgi:hypothetical protein
MQKPTWTMAWTWNQTLTLAKNDKEGHKNSMHRHGRRNVVRMCIVTPFCGDYDLSHTYELRKYNTWKHSRPIRLGAVYSTYMYCSAEGLGLRRLLSHQLRLYDF